MEKIVLYGIGMTNSIEFSDNYLKYLNSLIEKLDRNEIASFVDHVLSIRDHDKSIFFLGNGGSASTASHFVNDISLGSGNLKNLFEPLAFATTKQ